jgi:hypothetical protein
MTDKAKPKRGRGRPSSFTQAVADEICARMAEGESLKSVLRDDGMPKWQTVYRWTESNEDFRAQYTRARNAQAQRWVDEIVEIADDDSNDWTEGKDGVPVVNGEAIARSRLRVDTRKWIACKVLPKLYGEKIEHEHSGKVTLEGMVLASMQAPAKAPEQSS